MLAKQKQKNQKCFMDTATAPKLAAPGAGLPRLELALARLMFAGKRRSGSREDLNDEFRRERVAIGKRVADCEPGRRGERVLIKRPRGLEDSSRHWSLWMTLEHLRICNEGFARFITVLGRGETPAGRVCTADVKPSPGVGAEAEAGFEASCDALLDAVAAVPDLRTPVRHPHPWFGPLDAAAWHALSALHLALHRRQVELIVAGLRG